MVCLRGREHARVPGVGSEVGSQETRSMAKTQATSFVWVWPVLFDSGHTDSSFRFSRKAPVEFAAKRVLYQALLPEKQVAFAIGIRSDHNNPDLRIAVSSAAACLSFHIGVDFLVLCW